MGQQPLTLGAGLGGQAAAYGANAGASLLRGGLSAALTEQQANQISPLGTFLTGASKDPRLQTGFENFTMNRNIAGAVPQSTPFTPMSSTDLDALISGNYGQRTTQGYNLWSK
jgi:hypothetical protein